MLNRAPMIRHLEDARCRRLVVSCLSSSLHFPAARSDLRGAREETSATPAAAEPSQAKIDACSLLTSEEIESMLPGLRPVAAQLGGFPSTQCVFMTTTPANWVSIVITQSAPKSSHGVREFWQETFHRKAGEERPGGDREDGGEEEKKAPPQKVADLGDEAFWREPRSAPHCMC